MKPNLIYALVATAMLTACATRPESISASYISYEKYMGQDCTHLAQLQADAREELRKVSAQQDSRANLDAASVFFVLIPASKLSGDHAGDVAKWKGEVEAIDTALVKTGCKTLAKQ